MWRLVATPELRFTFLVLTSLLDLSLALRLIVGANGDRLVGSLVLTVLAWLACR